MRGGAGGHRSVLSSLGLPSPQVEALGAYLDVLAQWSRRVNLTGARSPEERVELLVTSVLPALPLPDPGPLIDVGSGNGSPGLVLAVLRPDLEVTLLEPRRRRWAFLREAVRAAGRSDLQVLRTRHDQYAGPPVATVTLRALALPLTELAPLLKPGGRLLVFGRAAGALGPFERRSEEEGGRPGVQVFRRRG